MAKYAAISSVKAAQEGNLGQVELPTQQTPEATPEAAPQQEPQGLMAELQAYQPTPEENLQAEVDTQAAIGEALPELQQEVDRQSIPSMQQRSANPQAFQKWQYEAPVTAKESSDAGLRNRASKMAANIASGDVGLLLTARGSSGTAVSLEKQGVSGPAIADAITADRGGEGTLYSAMQRVNAIALDPVGKPTLDPMYAQVASAVTENELMNQFAGDSTAQEGFDFEEAGKTTLEKGLPKPDIENQVVAQAQANAQLGQQIHLEYQRMQGVQAPEKLPSRQEAEQLGAAFKNLWATNNPELVSRTIDPKTNQAVYQLTADGETILKDGEEARKKLFPKINVKPAKQPLLTRRGQLPGDVGQNITKRTSGSVPTAKGQAQKFGRVLEGAMENLAQVPNVVDKQRAKILFATALPALLEPVTQPASWMADINNFGRSKQESFAAAKAQQDKKKQEAAQAGEKFSEPDYDPVANMNMLRNKIAQEVRAVAQERNGANYLSYNIQGFQGRITPQQSYFNPTTSKAVRFVTRNAVPAIAKPGSRIDKNLRQMYAMMLVKGADVKLPDAREFDLTAATPQLEAWGDRLIEALDQTMTDDQYEAVAQAMEEGKPLTDPVFQQNLKPLALDPQKDAELISKIQSKGEDGPHFIDGLIDFAKYIKARRAGKPHQSYFNAYMDGKTNGLATNGIQMGHTKTAQRTGVIRSNKTDLLDAEGDIRDVLKELALKSIDDGWVDGTKDVALELSDVARTVYGYRDLNKMVTMTFGYGKDSFAPKFEETIALMSEQAKSDPNSTFNQSLLKLDQTMSRKEIAETLWNKYETSLIEVMSEDALQARALMRSSAALHAAMNQIMSIKGPTGMDINLGRSQSTGYDAADKTTYTIEKGGEREKFSVAHYDNEPTAAAARTMDNQKVAGEYAYGGSVVAPVQAMDAATVALTATGKSWDRMSKASGGNPYMHTIYDAFKCDAMGYDVMLEEVNKNWLNTGMKWNYLEETYNSTKEALAKFNKEMASRDPNSTLTENEASYMQFMLGVTESKSSGKQGMHNLAKKLMNFQSMDIKTAYDKTKVFSNEMKKVGYNVFNPPEKPTVKQLRAFVKTLSNELNLGSRLSSAIKKNNAAKAELKKEIMKNAYRTPSGERIALQYYAH